jgi:hypothetical protein
MLFGGLVHGDGLFEALGMAGWLECNGGRLSDNI